ncbi:MAG: hypothetical protein PUD59_05360 [bacterium]|nr:hypothetical protein [bacterium]
MSNIILRSDLDINKLKLIKNGDSGFYGKIYRLDNEECVKIYNTFNKYVISYSIKELIDLTKINIPNVINPKKVIIRSFETNYDEIALGYIMDYIDGNTLNEIDKMRIKVFLQKYKNLLETVKQISNLRIVIQDCHLGNIMLNKNTGNFVFIDIDDWHFEKNLSNNMIVKTNFEYINNSIMSKILYYGFDKIAGKVDHNTDIVDFYSTFFEKESKEKRISLKTIRDLRNTYK